jgi:hypothetical protein
MRPLGSCLGRYILGFFVLATLAHAPAAQAWCRYMRPTEPAPRKCAADGNFVGWLTRCGGYSLLAPSFPPEVAIPMDTLRATARIASAAWNQAVCDSSGSTHPYFKILELSDTSILPGYQLEGDNANTVAIKSMNSSWGRGPLDLSDTIAITILTANANNVGEIVDADIVLNAEHFRFVTDSLAPDIADASMASQTLPRVDLQTVLMHEFGHFQGLDETLDLNSVMSSSVHEPEQTQRQLSPDDMAGICAVFPPDRAPAGSCDVATVSADLAVRRGCSLAPVGGGMGIACLPVFWVFTAGCVFARRLRRKNARRPKDTFEAAADH